MTQEDLRESEKEVILTLFVGEVRRIEGFIVKWQLLILDLSRSVVNRGCLWFQDEGCAGRLLALYRVQLLSNFLSRSLMALKTAQFCLIVDLEYLSLFGVSQSSEELRDFIVNCRIKKDETREQ